VLAGTPLTPEMTARLPEFALLTSSRLVRAWLTPPPGGSAASAAAGGRDFDAGMPALTPAGLDGAIAWERVVNLVASADDGGGAGGAAAGDETLSVDGAAGPTISAVSYMAVPVTPLAAATAAVGPGGSPGVLLGDGSGLEADLVCVSIVADIERDYSPVVSGGRFFSAPTCRGVLNIRTQEMVTVLSCAATVRPQAARATSATAAAGGSGSGSGSSGGGAATADAGATGQAPPPPSPPSTADGDTISGEVINIEYFVPDMGTGGGMATLTSVLRRPPPPGSGGAPELTLLARMSAFCSRVDGPGVGGAWRSAAAAAAAGGGGPASLAVAGHMWRGSYGCGYAPATVATGSGVGGNGGAVAAVPMFLSVSPCGAASTFRLRTRAVATFSPPRVARPLPADPWRGGGGGGGGATADVAAAVIAASTAGVAMRAAVASATGARPPGAELVLAGGGRGRRPRRRKVNLADVADERARIRILRNREAAKRSNQRRRPAGGGGGPPPPPAAPRGGKTLRRSRPRRARGRAPPRRGGRRRAPPPGRGARPTDGAAGLGAGGAARRRGDDRSRHHAESTTARETRGSLETGCGARPPSAGRPATGGAPSTPHREWIGRARRPRGWPRRLLHAHTAGTTTHGHAFAPCHAVRPGGAHNSKSGQSSPFTAPPA